MKLIFHKPIGPRQKAKATIHSTGKLGFSSEAENMLALNENAAIKIATNEDDGDENLYAVIEKKIDEESFEVKKSGGYYYINASGLFDSLKIDYKADKIIFDIEEIEMDGQKLFKFKKRVINKKKMEDEIN
ncbi:hypothetical protein ACLOAU_04645 [Niabella sp. CJ426]|uniref:hypothetical protein n=1 Tax=Niabella sp. CJ426 TaxID=3393740 RepID=UPI003D0219D9